MIIDYLDRAIDARYLGCFFWAEINLFRQSPPADLAMMRHTLSLLRRNMTRLLAHELSVYIEQGLAPIILHETLPAALGAPATSLSGEGADDLLRHARASRRGITGSSS